MFWSYSDSGSAAAALAALALIYTFLFIFSIIGYVITAFFLMKLYEKAGVQGKWRAWVPVYNTLVFAKLGDLNPWWLLALWGGAIVLSWAGIGALFGLAAGVYMVLAAWRIGLKLQKETPWVILYIFLSIVWLGIAAFDKSRWNPNIAPAPWAGNFLADKTVWSGIPVQPSAAVAGPGAPQGYAPPPAGYQAPPTGYQAPPAGAPGQTPPPPAGYQAPPPAAPPSNEPPAAPRG